MSNTCGTYGATLGPSETIHVVGEGPRLLSLFQSRARRADWHRLRRAAVSAGRARRCGRCAAHVRIRSILVPTGHELEAVEKTETDRPGYRFAVLGDFEADPWELFQRLFASIRDAVSTRHVRRSGFGWQLTSDHRLVGRIEWDPESEARLPLVRHELSRARSAAVFLQLAPRLVRDLLRHRPCDRRF